MPNHKNASRRQSIKESDREILLAAFEQNWLHIRHMENERMLFINAFVAIVVATIYAVSRPEGTSFLAYGLLLLLLFSMLNFLLALKAEAVIDAYAKNNQKILDRLSLNDYASIRVSAGLWKVIRFRYLIPGFYLAVSVILGSAILFRLLLLLMSSNPAAVFP